MRDGIEDAQVWESHRPKLTYPFAEAPALGEALDVAPGVKWMRMPLGGAGISTRVTATSDWRRPSP